MSRKLTQGIRKQGGFTLIELMFAMSAFSIMLIVAVSGLLNAMLIYNQANVSRNNQQEVRTLVDTIGRDIRTASSAKIFVGATTDGLCLLTGSSSFMYTVEGQQLVKQSVNKCDTPTVLSTTTLTATGVVVTGFEVVKVMNDGLSAGANKAETVTVTLKLRRGAAVPANARERQFNNEFGMTSTYLLRSGS